MKNSNKIIALILAMVTAMGCMIGGTMAWLITKTTPVVNTFTYGDINIDLDETDTDIDGDENPDTNEYPMIPGNEIVKDPTVTVFADSEACWLFVKVEKSENFDDFMEYKIDEGWTLLEGEENVYYREVEKSEEDQAFNVIADNTVTVKASVTKEMLNALNADPENTTYPTMTFTAYAVQKDNIDTVADAWYFVENPEATEVPTETTEAVEPEESVDTPEA